YAVSCCLPSLPTRRSSDLGFFQLRGFGSTENHGTHLGVLKTPCNSKLRYGGAHFFGQGIELFRLGDLRLSVFGFKTGPQPLVTRSEEHTSELQSRENLVCR